MRSAFASLALALTLAVGVLGTAGCTILQDPAKVEGALPSEANELRVIQGALVVKAANDTIVQQLKAGLITTAEATRLRGVTKQAEAAVAAARLALPLENGDTTARITALNQILLTLLREQVIKAGAS